jgi:hypothetical protein
LDLGGIVAAFGELTHRGELASFYRLVVMAMDLLVLMALGGVQVLSRKKTGRTRPFLTFHIFSLTILALVAYAFLLHRAGQYGPGKEGALLHAVFLVWILLICLWEWFIKNTKLGGAS